MSARRLPRRCSALVVTFALALGLGWTAVQAEAADKKPPGVKAKPAVTLTPHAPNLAPPAPTSMTAGSTRCAACHKTTDWRTTSGFAHERTGFPLKGRHAGAACRVCHGDDLSRPLPTACAACHRDVHAGDRGAHCEGCHDEETWRSRFSADAHRRTNFPLGGRHALIPCEECHRQARDRAFSRAAVRCEACHQADYQNAALRSVDHAAAGFSTDCRLCHGTFKFSPARFADHDRCFQITGGPHGGIKCTGCHSSVPSVQMAGACDTGTAACTRCHEHGQARTDREHRDVPGYQWKDRKCYECHRFTRGGG